jgi:hypothetical protein
MQYALTVQARVRTSHNRFANRSNTSDFQLSNTLCKGKFVDYYTAICHDYLMPEHIAPGGL